MNTVYSRYGKTPLTPEQLAREANAITEDKPFTPDMFEGPKSRISGDGHCWCAGNGEFELLPVYHRDVVQGKKRYMVCRKCGAYSHL